MTFLWAFLSKFIYFLAQIKFFDKIELVVKKIASKIFTPNF